MWLFLEEILSMWILPQLVSLPCVLDQEKTFHLYRDPPPGNHTGRTFHHNEALPRARIQQLSNKSRAKSPAQTGGTLPQLSFFCPWLPPLLALAHILLELNFLVHSCWSYTSWCTAPFAFPSLSEASTRPMLGCEVLRRRQCCSLVTLPGSFW